MSEPHRFFQGPKDGDDKNTRKEAENRLDNDRVNLSKEMQDVVNVLDKRITGKIANCRDYCVIPKRAHKDVPLAVMTMEKIGEGNIGKAINEFGDQHIELRDIISTKKDMFKKAMYWMIPVILGGLITLLILGLREYLKHGS